jgi:hypothetical protein
VRIEIVPEHRDSESILRIPGIITEDKPTYHRWEASQRFFLDVTTAEELMSALNNHDEWITVRDGAICHVGSY